MVDLARSAKRTRRSDQPERDDGGAQRQRRVRRDVPRSRQPDRGQDHRRPHALDGVPERCRRSRPTREPGLCLGRCRQRRPASGQGDPEPAVAVHPPPAGVGQPVRHFHLVGSRWCQPGPRAVRLLQAVPAGRVGGVQPGAVQERRRQRRGRARTRRGQGLPGSSGTVRRHGCLAPQGRAALRAARLRQDPAGASVGRRGRRPVLRHLGFGVRRIARRRRCRPSARPVRPGQGRGAGHHLHR